MIALEIITDAPRLPWRERRRLGVGWVVGVPLVVLAVSALALLLPVTLLLAYRTLSDQESRVFDLLKLAAVDAVAVGALLLGKRLVRGQRRLVLFLRRFGFVGASAVVTYAVGTAAGRNFRLVTLDDASITGVGEQGGAHWNRARWLTAALFAVGLALVAWWVFGHAGDHMRDIAGSIADDIQQGSKGQGLGKELGAAFVGAFVGGFMGAVVVVLIGFAIAAPIIVTGGFAVLSWGVARSIRRAEAVKAARVEAPESVSSIVVALQQRMRLMFAPRLVVLRCVDAAWQELVLALVSVSSVVLIDISDPSEHVLWELNVLREKAKSAIILIGQRDRIEALRAGQIPQLSPAEFAQLAELLRGQQVLTYEDDAGRSRDRFARALQARMAIHV